MKNYETKPTNRERLMYLNIIASKDAQRERELAEKDEIIEFYKQTAEKAVERKHRALDKRDEHRKDIICWGILVVCIALSIWLTGMAIHEFLLWASGN